MQCHERRYADHICIFFSDILQNAPFRSQIFKILFASGGKGALTPNQNPADALGRCSPLSSSIYNWLSDDSQAIFEPPPENWRRRTTGAAEHNLDEELVFAGSWDT